MRHAHSRPRAIAHIDGDSFFASVEQAVKPHLRGKPVVTGKERNIVAAASVEAKRLGITRGVTLWDAKNMCPELVVLPTDYETVSLFSKRMYDIMRRYTPEVEEYSIDEAFVDLTGLRRVHHASYETIARRIQHDIHTELGITVSVGLSVTKTLSKIASSRGKPAGFAAISMRDIPNTLRDVPVGDVWGVGQNTAELLSKYNLPSAYAFACAERSFISALLTKPGVETWEELNGTTAIPLGTCAKRAYQSISKVKTFTPPSSERAYVFAQLVKNIENACIKARRYHQAARRMTLFLRREDFRGSGIEAKLDRASAFPNELLPTVEELFDELFVANVRYRATGVVLGDLTQAHTLQPSLFEDPVRVASTQRLYGAIDELRAAHGKHAVRSAASMPAHATQHVNARGDTPVRTSSLLRGETARRRLPIPMLQKNVL